MRLHILSVVRDGSSWTISTLLTTLLVVSWAAIATDLTPLSLRLYLNHAQSFTSAPSFVFSGKSHHRFQRPVYNRHWIRGSKGALSHNKNQC